MYFDRSLRLLAECGVLESQKMMRRHKNSKTWTQLDLIGKLDPCVAVTKKHGKRVLGPQKSHFWSDYIVFAQIPESCVRYLPFPQPIRKIKKKNEWWTNFLALLRMGSIGRKKPDLTQKQKHQAKRSIQKNSTWGVISGDFDASRKAVPGSEGGLQRKEPDDLKKWPTNQNQAEKSQAEHDWFKKGYPKNSKFVPIIAYSNVSPRVIPGHNRLPNRVEKLRKIGPNGPIFPKKNTIPSKNFKTLQKISYNNFSCQSFNFNHFGSRILKRSLCCFVY